MIEYINDYISGEKFTDVCDVIFNTESWVKNKEEKNINNIFNIKKETIIIYCRPNYINEVKMLLNIFNHTDKKIILVTHNSDYKIDSLLEDIYLQFSQNVNIISDKIVALPIGLENSYNFPEIRKIDKMKLKLSEEKNYKNLIYMNHTISTNPFVRAPLYQMFGDKSYFTTDWNKNNGIDFDSYLDNIYNHKFVLSPEGNGIDTHRTWECLYLGTIPIEKRNINNKYWEDKLPICYVNDWSEINQDFLNAEYDRIINSNWNLDMLKFDYWKKLILSYVK
jgi:hypothetical protein